MSKPKKPKTASAKEAKLLEASLEKRGQVQDAGSVLAPGVTHERVIVDGKEVLKRRRFSAL